MIEILCICGLGQGTSLLLRMNVEEVLKEIGVKANVDNTDVSSASFTRADYVITNKVLAEQITSNTPKILVENYFDKEEIKRALLKELK
jgi:PTS system ascorbate-specific IIB component